MQSMWVLASSTTYPFFEGSAEALKAGMEENARQNPDKVLEVKRAIAEGDFVAVHSHVRQKTRRVGRGSRTPLPVRERTHRRVVGSGSARAGEFAKPIWNVLENSKPPVPIPGKLEIN